MSVTVNGTGERELTFGLRPRFSPDGGMIVVSSHDAATNRMELLLTPASGGGRTRLTKEDSPQVRDSDYAFSADGSYIAYIGGFDLEAYQNPQLFVIPTDGSAPARRIELPEGLRVVGFELVGGAQRAASPNMSGSRRRRGSSRSGVVFHSTIAVQTAFKIREVL